MIVGARFIVPVHFYGDIIMIRKTIFISAFLFFANCGGGSSSSPFDGMYKMVLHQKKENCEEKSDMEGYRHYRTLVQTEAGECFRRKIYWSSYLQKF
jgi:hypothetical protein